MAEPLIAQKSPFKFEVVKGKNYFWCACGRSKNQPFCDGSHKTVFFCGCKHSAKKPFCDGTHSRL
jgi:CDGSH-type Zn-finger protein